MAVLINFKICDNSKDCGGITVCPAGAFYWDNKKKTIAVDNKKCVSCGKCEEACPVGAIRVARTEKEYKKIKETIKKDPRKISDLFVDRYGADSISSTFLIPSSKFKDQIFQSKKLAAIEFFTPSSIQCLLYSIPIKELLKNANANYLKVKVEKNPSFLKKFKIKKFPTLAFFKMGKLVGLVEGYYEIGQEKILKEKIKKIISKAK